MVENKRKVKKALREKKIDIALSTKWPFIGPFLQFLEKKGIMKEFKNIVSDQIRKMIGSEIFTLLYVLKLIAGIPRIRGSEALLGDFGAMKLVGFSVDTLQNGLCNRGDANQYGRDYKKNPLGSWMSLHY